MDGRRGQFGRQRLSGGGGKGVVFGFGSLEGGLMRAIAGAVVGRLGMFVGRLGGRCRLGSRGAAGVIVVGSGGSRLVGLVGRRGGRVAGHGAAAQDRRPQARERGDEGSE